MASKANDSNSPFVWRAVKGGAKVVFTGLKIGIAAAGIKSLILDPIADRNKKSKTISTSINGVGSTSTSASFTNSVRGFAESNATPASTGIVRDGISLNEESISDDIDFT